MTLLFVILLSALWPLLPVQSQTATVPPTLPEHHVKLVVPPVPAQMTDLPALPQSTSQQQTPFDYLNGAINISLRDLLIPRCCFCPDGAETPVRWEPPKREAGKR